MLSQFISNWIHILFVLWIILYYMKYDVSLLNISYLLYLLCFGYLFYVLYNLIQGIHYTIPFLIFNLTTHILPLIIFIKLGFKSNKYSKYIAISVIILYLLYLHYIDKNVVNVYFIDDQLSSFEEVFNACLEDNIFIPICTITKLLNREH